MEPTIEIIEADRPTTKEEEDTYLLRAYRETLEDIANTLGLLGSPDLLIEVPKEVARLRNKELLGKTSPNLL